MNQPLNQLLNILENVEDTRETMFDITEIPHCLEPLEETCFSLDMKRIKAAHQYMKGNIPDNMYYTIKKQLRRCIGTLLEGYRQLLSINRETIIDEQTAAIFMYLKQFFSNNERLIKDMILRIQTKLNGDVDQMNKGNSSKKHIQEGQGEEDSGNVRVFSSQLIPEF